MLPPALLRVRITPQSRDKLSPLKSVQETLSGSLLQTPSYEYLGQEHLCNYVISPRRALSSINKYFHCRNLIDLDLPVQDIQVGDWV